MTKRRVARKHHWCSCGRSIRPGDAYLEHTLFPSNDAGWDLNAPARIRECRGCAERYGRTVEVGTP